MAESKPGERIDINVMANGQLITDWSDKQINDLFCAICRDCPGWDEPKHKIDCVTASRFCG